MYLIRLIFVVCFLGFVDCLRAAEMHFYVMNTSLNPVTWHTYKVSDGSFTAGDGIPLAAGATSTAQWGQYETTLRLYGWSSVCTNEFYISLTDGMTMYWGCAASAVWRYETTVHNPNPFPQSFDWVGPDGVVHHATVAPGGDYQLSYSGTAAGPITVIDTSANRVGDAMFIIPANDPGWSSSEPNNQEHPLSGAGLPPLNRPNMGTNGPLNFDGLGAWALDSTVREGFNQTYDVQQQGFAGMFAGIGRLNTGIGLVSSGVSAVNSSLSLVNNGLASIKTDTGLIKTDADSIKESTAMATNLIVRSNASLESATNSLGNLKTNFNQFRSDFQDFTNQNEYLLRQIRTNSFAYHMTNGVIGDMMARLQDSQTDGASTTNGWGIGSIVTAASLEDLTSDLAANSGIWILNMAGHSVDLNPFHQAWFVALGNWTRLAVGILVHTWVLILVINGVIHTIEVSGLSPAQTSASNLPYVGRAISVIAAVAMYALFAALCTRLIGVVIGVRGDGMNVLTMGTALVSGQPEYIRVAVGLLSHFIPFAVCLSALVQRISIQFYCMGAFFVYNRIQHKAVA